MKDFDYPDTLFILLVVIIFIAIIIITVKNCKKKEYFDLGDSIDNVVNSALKEVSQTMDDATDDADDTLININNNYAPISIGSSKDLQGDLSKHVQYHHSDITSDKAVPKENTIGQNNKMDPRHAQQVQTNNNNRQLNNNPVSSESINIGNNNIPSNMHTSINNNNNNILPPDQPQPYYPSDGSDTGRNCLNCLNENDVLNYKKSKNRCECNNEILCGSGDCVDKCKWCIDKNYDGNCIPIDEECDSGPYIPKEKCTISGEELPSEYKNIGCDLYKNYKKCLNCVKEKKCGILYTDGVKCGNPTNDKDNGCMDKSFIHKKKTWNCLNPPYGTVPGFGCPDGKAPVDPSTNNNNVCINETFIGNIENYMNKKKNKKHKKSKKMRNSKLPFNQIGNNSYMSHNSINHASHLPLSNLGL